MYLKTAKIVPIPKEGTPIKLVSFGLFPLLRLKEKILCKQLWSRLEPNHLQYRCQYGFELRSFKVLNEGDKGLAAIFHEFLEIIWATAVRNSPKKNCAFMG